MLQNICETMEKNSNNFVCPDYKKNCISNIPQLVSHALNATKKSHKESFEEKIEETDYEEANSVVLVVIDGFGFNQFLKYYRKNKFLSKLADQGDAFPLTSTFPSQTTNALTTLNTGLTPQEHGLFEYFIYLKNIGIVNTLSFERTGNKQNNLNKEDPKPNILLSKGKTIHTKLKEKGINSFTHINAYNAANACSKLIFQGSTIVPGLKLSDTIVGLRKNIEKNRDQKSYFFVHLDSIDTIAHEYGPESYETQVELSLITHLLNKELVQKIDKKTAKKTLLFVTADHGGLSVNPKQTTYLNFSNYTVPNLQTEENLTPISPTGSLREVFLHIKEEKIQETKQLLEKKLGSKAQILETKEAAKNGFFGIGATSEEFFERTGNLMILPFENETVWFENSEGRRVNFLGQHGGLNEQEMLVPFAAANLCSLK
ncbi:MAG: alkaline phosphatase family protein [Candidatus Bathyarchaeia archaeon]|jgi:predicted AlkP superfamily pyrophosphatase or phosphodiesterase